MKKLIAMLLCVMLLTGSVAALAENWFTSTEPAATEKTYVTTTGDVNVRKGPGLGYASMGAVKSGNTLEFLNETSVDERGVAWYKVSFNGQAGWVSSKYSTTEAAKPKYVTTTGNVNVRKGPGTDYATLGTADKGTTLKYMNETRTDARGVEWFCVEFRGQTGWVSSRYASLEGYTPAPVTYVKATGSVNVRSGPGGKYEDLSTLEKGEQVVYLNQSAVDANGDTWYKVQYYDYYQAWVMAKYCKLVQTGEVGVPADSKKVTGSYVKATGGKSTLRSQPDLEAKSLAVIQKGQTATYLGDYSVDNRGVTWYKVSYNGKTGWVSSRYTTLY